MLFGKLILKFTDFCHQSTDIITILEQFHLDLRKSLLHFGHTMQLVLVVQSTDLGEQPFPRGIAKVVWVVRDAQLSLRHA